MLDSMQAQVASLGSQSEQLLAAGRLVVAGQ
jgi:hypothetical protein